MVRRLFCILVVAVFVGCKGKTTAPVHRVGSSPAPVALTNLPPQVRSYIERKEQLAHTLAKKLGGKADRATLGILRARAVCSLVSHLLDAGLARCGGRPRTDSAWELLGVGAPFLAGLVASWLATITVTRYAKRHA